MKIDYLSYSSVPHISKKDLAYIDLVEPLSDFYKYEPKPKNFEKVIADKSNDLTNRSLLTTELKRQYSSYSLSKDQLANIEALNSKNTFTITTAHQPCLFTGPLYTIYKIASTINLTNTLNSTYPNHKFVPVFVTGGEDHDLDEMNHCTVFNNKIIWDRDQGGPVGRMSKEGLEEAILHLKEILGENESTKQIFDHIDFAMNISENYGDFYCAFVNQLFKDFGLLVINFDNIAFKNAFIPIMKTELLESSSKAIINKTQQKLAKNGFKSQAFVRDINLFFLSNGKRERIEKENDKYILVESGKTFTEDEIISLLNKNPENFSPNVVMRPLFQEMILPNLAYIGGGGEISYWLERKTQFEFFGINFPMLIRRNSILWADKGIIKAGKKANLRLEDFFKEDVNQVINFYISENRILDFDFSKEMNDLDSLMKSIEEKVKILDPTLQKVVGAEKVKMLKTIEQLEKRMARIVKSNNETIVSKISNTHQKMFPGHSLQERKDNFTAYYSRYGQQNYLKFLVENLDPMDKRFIIIEED